MGGQNTSVTLVCYLVTGWEWTLGKIGQSGHPKRQNAEERKTESLDWGVIRVGCNRVRVYPVLFINRQPENAMRRVIADHGA